MKELAKDKLPSTKAGPQQIFVKFDQVRLLLLEKYGFPPEDVYMQVTNAQEKI